VSITIDRLSFGLQNVGRRKGSKFPTPIDTDVGALRAKYREFDTLHVMRYHSADVDLVSLATATHPGPLAAHQAREGREREDPH